MTDAATVAEPLEEIALRGYRKHKVFDDWVTALLAALARDEEPYLDVIQSYPNEEDVGDREADLFSKATGALFAATAEHQHDVLGDVYEHLGLTNPDTGQFFTSHDAAALTARIEMDGSEESIKDPACGSGRMLLQASKIAPEALFVGRDLDIICAQMAAINLCLFNLDGIIIYGDSLKLTRERAWITKNTPSGGGVTEVEPDNVAWIDGGYDGPDDDPEYEQVTLQEVPAND